MDEHDDDVESTVREDAEQETVGYPDTGDELDEDETFREDEDEAELDEDESEL